MSEESDLYLKEIARDIREIALNVRSLMGAIKEAESEVPEKMRRFMMYFHDVHDLRDLYHGGGQEPPAYVRREIEKCDDRLRHLLEDLYAEGGTFEKVRQEMTNREGNRYDHGVLLPKQEKVDEAGNRKEVDGAQGVLPGLGG